MRLFRLFYRFFDTNLHISATTIIVLGHSALAGRYGWISSVLRYGTVDLTQHALDSLLVIYVRLRRSRRGPPLDESQ